MLIVALIIYAIIGKVVYAIWTTLNDPDWDIDAR
jgi:hypothetical protein